MSILTALRARFSARDSSAVPSASDDAQPGVGLPFAGYDELDDTEVVEGLSDHSQTELEAVEGYERSHQNRVPVLDKLRFMRQREPLPDYDALTVEEIVTALTEADLATIKKVRGYERKFANRPDVVDEAVRLHQERRAAQPAKAPPAYQPMSATSTSNGTSGSIDRGEKSGRP
jgi:hypothetical protein